MECESLKQRILVAFPIDRETLEEVQKDPFGWTFHLSRFGTEGSLELFGALLLALLDATDLDVSVFQERLETGLQFTESASKLKGIEKVVGRDTQHLIAALTDNQWQATIQWQEFMINSMRQRMGPAFLEEGTMLIVLEWLRGRPQWSGSAEP